MKVIRINNTLFLSFRGESGTYKIYIKISDIISFETDTDTGPNGDKISEICLNNNKTYGIFKLDRLTIEEISNLIDIYNRGLEAMV